MSENNKYSYNSGKNELTPEVMSLHALNKFSPWNSSPRCVMFGSQFSQRPVIEGSEPHLTVTGVENEMGKYTFSVRMPENGTIISKIAKYGMAPDGMRSGMSPEVLVIYQSHETGKFGCFTVPYFCSHDPVFGFKYEIKDNYFGITPGADIAKDTIFADSPAVKGDSHYTYSKNLNLCYMSHPNVGLDGFVVSSDVLHHFKFRVYEKRVIEFGAGQFLLNIYGDDSTYKPFPDIGERLKQNGLLAAIRRYDPLMAPALTSRKDTQRIDYHFDEPVFARPGVGRVVDITVVESSNTTKVLPEEMTEQVRRYHIGCMQYYKEVLRFYDTEVAKSRRNGRNGFVPVTEELNALIIQARALTSINNGDKNNLILTHKSKPLDNWRVEFVVEYEVIPSRGFKLSCDHGGKGIVCRIEKPENMPIDADGNRADIITGPDSVPGRMNIGRLYSPYLAAAARDVKKAMLECLGYPRNFKGVMSLGDLTALPIDAITQAVNLLLKYYSITSNRSYKEFTETLTQEEQYIWLLDIFNGELYNYMPVDDDDMPLDKMVLEIEKNFKLTYGPVSYVGHSGQRVVTKNAARIAPLPIMLLDKIADSWLATSSGKHSNFGILTARVRADKNMRPWKATPPRVVGETEGRIYCGYGGRLFIAELIDRNGNIATQREVAKNIIAAEQPFNIPKLVSREKIPFGNTRPLQIVNQFLFCMGVKMHHTVEKAPPMSQTLINQTNLASGVLSVPIEPV